MATYLNNLFNSIWSSWEGLFEGLPYGEEYAPVVVLLVLFTTTIKFIANGRS